tara:strand:+ start:32 stop:724 length:693 start_codon:yes stop_codon:yes gene_type:complete
MSEANANENKGLFDDLLSEQGADQGQEGITTDPTPETENENLELKRQLAKQEEEIQELREQGKQLGKLKSAFLDEEPSEEDLETQRLTEAFDRDPGTAIKNIKAELREEHEAARFKEKKALDFAFMKRELAADYDVDFNDPKVQRALHDELKVMDPAYKERDMKGAMLKAMRLTGNDKKKAPNHFADVSSISALQEKQRKEEGNKIFEGIKKAKEESGKGKVLGHIFGNN